jgi:hypothetical protein
VLEKYIRHVEVIVLAGMDYSGLCPCFFFQSVVERGDFHEIRAGCRYKVYFDLFHRLYTGQDLQEKFYYFTTETQWAQRIMKFFHCRETASAMERPIRLRRGINCYAVSKHVYYIEYY